MAGKKQRGVHSRVPSPPEGEGQGGGSSRTSRDFTPHPNHFAGPNDSPDRLAGKIPQGGREFLAEAIQKLSAAGIEDASREARLIQRNAPDEESFAAMVARRAAREPMSHILGRREFWSLDFAVTRHCLDPRPDSETVVETVLASLPDRARPLRILDLGTGSGCLLLALLSELPNATGVGVDASVEALGIAMGNAHRLGFGTRAQFVQRRWTQGLDGNFDIVVSNPPYIPTDEIDRLAPEVARYEPRLALDGGRDGLDAYRAILPGLKRVLAPDGFAVLEIGADQAEKVCRLAETMGFLNQTVHKDLGGRDRAVKLSQFKKMIGN